MSVTTDRSRGCTANTKVLVVEDEYFIANDLRVMLEASGAKVVGPTGRCDEALALVEENSIDFAVLDINLGGELAYVVADTLVRRGVPFVFATGYSEASIPMRFENTRRYEKPYRYEELLQAFNEASPVDEIG